MRFLRSILTRDRKFRSTKKNCVEVEIHGKKIAFYAKNARIKKKLEAAKKLQGILANK